MLAAIMSSSYHFFYQPAIACCFVYLTCTATGFNLIGVLLQPVWNNVVLRTASSSKTIGR